MTKTTAIYGNTHVELVLPRTVLGSVYQDDNYNRRKDYEYILNEYGRNCYCAQETDGNLVCHNDYEQVEKYQQNLVFQGF